MQVLAVDDKSISLSSKPTSDEAEVDTDNDGLADYLEEYFNTNANNPDTDEDGVWDYIEVCRTCTNPLVPDGYLDSDCDGLSNALECRLDTKPDDKDTDNDTLSDYDEVYVLLTDPLIKNNLEENPLQEDKGGTENPYQKTRSIIDPDISVDNGSSNGVNETYEGLLYTSYGDENVVSTISYKLSRTWFRTSNSTYNSKLAAASSIATALAYDGNYLFLDDGEQIGSSSVNALSEWMAYHGMIHFESYDLHESRFQIRDCHKSKMYIAHTSITVGGVSESIICVVIRGTYGNSEWESNFDIGSTSEFSSYSEWTEVTNHRGFDITANRLNGLLDDYIDTYCSDTTNVLWITGHSRGGAVANLLAAKRVSAGDNVFCYTFASPATTTNANANTSDYNCIFNIINRDDIVTKLPLASWSFVRFGVDKDSISIEESYADEWDSLNNSNLLYNSGLLLTNETIASFGDIAASRDACYVYRTGSDSFHCVESQVELNNQLSKYPSNAAGLYYFEILTSSAQSLSMILPIIIRYANIYQKPAFFMQILSAVMGGSIKSEDFVLIDVAPYLEDAKAKIVLLAADQKNIKHPHYFESYYLLATIITE